MTMQKDIVFKMGQECRFLEMTTWNYDDTAEMMKNLGLTNKGIDIVVEDAMKRFKVRDIFDEGGIVGEYLIVDATDGRIAVIVFHGNIGKKNEAYHVVVLPGFEDDRYDYIQKAVITVEIDECMKKCTFLITKGDDADAFYEQGYLRGSEKKSAVEMKRKW